MNKLQELKKVIQEAVPEIMEIIKDILRGCECKNEHRCLNDYNRKKY